MEKITQSWIGLSIIAALGYGIGTPLWKLGMTQGATTAVVAFTYGSLAAILSYNKQEDLAVFANPKALLLSILTSICMAVGLVAFGKGAKLPNANISTMAIIISTYPIISGIIGLLFMGESATTNVPKFLLGMIVVIFGLCLVVTSSKNH